MNKELYIKKENKLEELQKLSFLVHSLKEFLTENEQNFKKEESIEALKRIKKYFEIKDKEYHDCEEKHKLMTKELISTCKHEIAIMPSRMPYYQCLICKQILSQNINAIPKKSIISVDVTNDYEVEYILEKIFIEVVYSDKDLIKTINQTVEELQYDRNIKIYRR